MLIGNIERAISVNGELIAKRGLRGKQGEQGIQGETGNGISSAVLNADYTLTLTFTNGTSYTTPSIRGQQGATGATGATGAKGDKGDTGEKGDKGDAGSTGATGNGISSITKTGTSGLVDTYTITFTNGTTTTFTVTNGDTPTLTWENIQGKPETYPPSSHTHDDRYYTETEINEQMLGKQPTLVSGTNIKTINNNSLLGSGNISIEAEDEIFIATYEVTTFAQMEAAYNAGKTIFLKVVDGNKFKLYPLYNRGLYTQGLTYYFEFTFLVTLEGIDYFAKKQTYTLTSNGWDDEFISVVVPTLTSDLENDSDFVTGSDIEDKEDKSNKVTSFSATPSDDNYPSEKLVKDSIPTKTSELTNDSGFIDSSYHDNTKVDKVNGKGLSTEDYTSAEKAKLGGIEAGANHTDLTPYRTASAQDAIDNTKQNLIDLSIVDGKLCVTYEEV